MKSPMYTIDYKFYDSLPTCLQTCSCKMYYVVHKFPKFSRVTIHLGTHSHLITKGMCKESFHEMKNLLIDEVCCKLTFTFLTIVLSASKSLIFHHLFNEDGEGPM